MVFGLRVEDMLEGAANFSPWKARISLILEENELWDIVHSTTKNPYRHPIINIVLTNRVKMNIHRRLVLSDKQEHQINILSNESFSRSPTQFQAFWLLCIV